MGSLSIWHWVMVGIVVLLLFGGRGKISDLMGDFAKGIKSFKKGMADEPETADAQKEPVKTIGQQPASATVAPEMTNRAATERKVEGTS